MFDEQKDDEGDELSELSEWRNTVLSEARRSARSSSLSVNSLAALYMHAQAAQASRPPQRTPFDESTSPSGESLGSGVVRSNRLHLGARSHRLGIETLPFGERSVSLLAPVMPSSSSSELSLRFSFDNSVATHISFCRFSFISHILFHFAGSLT